MDRVRALLGHQVLLLREQSGPAEKQQYTSFSVTPFGLYYLERIIGEDYGS